MLASRNKPNPVKLAFHSVDLRVSDVDLLKGPNFINSRIIAFYYEWLEYSKYKSNSDLLFLSTEKTVDLKSYDNTEMEEMFSSMNASKKAFIFFALCNEEPRFPAETRFSLLVLSRPEKCFFHFDWQGDAKSIDYMQFVMQVKDVLGGHNYPTKSIRCGLPMKDFDRGLLMLSMTETVAAYVNHFESVDGVQPVSVDAVSAKRHELLRLIRSLLPYVSIIAGQIKYC